MAEPYRGDVARARDIRLLRQVIAELPVTSAHVRDAIEACLAAGDDAAIKTAWQLLDDALDALDADER